VPAPAVPAEPGAAEREHRPQPLSAARDKVARELRDQLYWALHALYDQLVDAIEVAPEKLGQRVQRGIPARRYPIDTRPERHPNSPACSAGLPNGGPISLTRPNPSEHRLKGRPVKSRAIARRSQPRENARAMKELLRTNDPVRLSFLEALLRDSGIDSLVLDHHTSLVEGSIGAIPRRLMVSERDYRRARLVLAAAGEEGE
jgi:hypothetical protein